MRGSTKERNRKMSYIGFLLLMLGAAGMDRQNQIPQAIMVFLGLVIILVSAYKEYLIGGNR